ncbi:IBR domain [Seminavis robusta]|uniref:IBR domain n=1 Tax=Seminavis robusta TaxID=568900 RepID=A0A9N8HEC4_9STRA|nr:IBR domain [Seminavis robusta]|eukprot:Sro508_g156860.1 IBR domain (510) ;mRNA; f:47983-49633
MSSKRPGTVDYSHFDNIDCSSSSEEEEEEDYAEDRARNGPIMAMQRATAQRQHREEEAKPPAKVPKISNTKDAISNLAFLQKAWGNTTTITTTGNNEKLCASCHAHSPHYKCSRCQITCLACPGSHFMCTECTGVYVKSVLSDLESSYPPKCSMCKAHFDLGHFERQLTSKQQLQVQLFAAQRKLLPGQELMQCSSCNALEIVTPTKKAPLVLWWCKVCFHGTCVVCQKALPLACQKGAVNTAKHSHELCLRFHHVKTAMEQALEKGSKMACPGCGLAGRKDDACTHMTCPKCETKWCYVCGLDVHQCDKAPPRRHRENDEDDDVDDIFLHNQDWQYNPARCPMYLTQILEVDLGWMGENWEANARDEDFDDDERCLDYFHRFQTIRLLQQVRAEVGTKEFDAAFEAFDSLRNSGYTLEEIISTDTTTLIDREDFRRYKSEQGDEDNGMLVDGATENVARMPVADGQWDKNSAMAAEEDAQVNDALARSEVSARKDEQVRNALRESQGD